VLFSSPEVSSYINQNFEPTWVSVRPVPKITIDFGMGKTMTRTVNGNIATYICTSDGSVIDVIPGIYSRSRYLSALSLIKNQFSELTSNPEQMNRKLIAYHSLSAPPLVPAVKVSAAASSPPAVPFEPTETNGSALNAALQSDSDLNESERRPLIHAYLRESLVKTNRTLTPDDIKHWLYREVLHADLDDPYLGFDRILTQTYPFATEDFGG